ncbi:MAG: lamin tail domain-containing protein [Chitinispirillaceae bacterium]|nr:lamin tail domain-containing protein [Chitinispirillaceae bacterium]
MSNFPLNKAAAAVSIAFFSFLFPSCGKMPLSATDSRESGSLEIRTCIFKNGLSKSAIAGVGLCDSIVIEISGGGLPLFRASSPFDLSLPVSTLTVKNIPAGKDQEVRVFTVDKSGSLIHIDSIAHRSVRIDPNVVTPLTVMLIPAVGSIYLQLDNIPTTVDSVFATFATGSGQPWVARAKRASKIYLSLEKIPHNTRGLLLVASVDVNRDTLYSASSELTFNACVMDNIVLNFASAPGTLSFDMGVLLPGITNVSGSITGTDTATIENGKLLMTEIMYAANDSEYVEVYNPGAGDLTFDTIIVEIDGAKRVFTGVVVAAGKTFVFGRKALPWVDTYHPTASALDLSGNGNWITIREKNGAIMDRVVFAGGSNTQEWPNVSGKRSIVLDKMVVDPKLNNFGRNWMAAKEIIEGTEDQYGTPRLR